MISGDPGAFGNHEKREPRKTTHVDLVGSYPVAALTAFCRQILRAGAVHPRRLGAH